MILYRKKAERGVFLKRKYTVGHIALKYSGLFVLGIILSFFTTWITIYCSDTVAKAVDAVMSEGREVELSAYICIILIMAVVMLIVTFVQNIIIRLYSVKAQTEYKNRMADKIPDIEYSYFDDKGSGSIMNRLIADVGELNKLFSENVPTLVIAIIVVVAVVSYMLVLDWKLSLVTIVIYPILLYLANYVSNKVKKLVNLRKNLLDERTAVAHDCIQGVVVGKSYNLEEVQEKRIGKVIDTVFANERARTGIQSLSYILEAIIGWIPVVISYVLALLEVLNGSITVGDMLAYTVLLGLVARNVEKIPMGIIELKECLVSVRRLNELMCAPVEATGEYTGQKTGQKTDINGFGVDVENEKNKEAIRFSDVKFSYSDGETDNVQVLKGVSFVAKKGQQTAIIGGSGGGKSTIFKLICGFYQINGGSYKLFGQEFDNWNLKSAREKLALVSQNVFLLPESIADNVAYGRPGATKEDIIAACKSANIHDFIINLPNGYDTLVGERGVRLSGGERQRISIARAFLKNAPILLLDEPTAAIDVETEKLIQEAIDRVSAGKTVITIAHRLNTIVNADKIYVIDGGVVAESGTHKDLLENEGVYAQLYGKQMESEVAYE